MNKNFGRKLVITCSITPDELRKLADRLDKRAKIGSFEPIELSRDKETQIMLAHGGLIDFEVMDQINEEQRTKDVHTEHCCFKHGCKYGDPDCPVKLGVKKQSFPCEQCDLFSWFR